MEDDRKKFESVFGVSNTRNTAPIETSTRNEESSPTAQETIKKSLSTGAQPSSEDTQSRAPPTRPIAQHPVTPVKTTNIKESKIQGFKQFADWNVRVRNQLALVRDILQKMLTAFQKKNQRNENRLNFIKAFYNAFMEDIGKTCFHQLEFANKAFPSFEAKDQQAMPVFEQGIKEMLQGIKSNEKQLQELPTHTHTINVSYHQVRLTNQELKVHFEKKIYDTMVKSLPKQQDFYTLMESCSKGMDSFTEVQERAAKEYDSFMTVFNLAMDEKKKKTEKDLFSEAHKFAGSIRYLIGVLKAITDCLFEV